jgi:Meckel syndrome type 1 protein
MLAAPVVPAFAGSRGGPSSTRGDGGRSDAALDTSSLAAATGGRTQLLRFGDVGPAVAAIQRQVGVASDGIFGPITRAAVERFQRVHSLSASGIVDARTWAALFNGRVLFYDDSGSSSGAAAEAHAATRASLRLVVDRTGGTDHASAEDTGDGPGSGSASGSGSGDGSATPPTTGPSKPAPSTSVPSAPAPSTAAPSAGGCTGGRIVAPVQGATVTGRFGESRPGHTHAGEDLAVASGTPIHAAQCGTVVQSGSEQGYGLMVCIRHAGGITTCYAHMSRTAATVSQQVAAGQVIGYVGCTGNCTGPHVHFEVRRGGTAVDPAPYLAGQQTIAGATSTASAAGATRTSTRRTTTVSAGRSTGTATHTVVHAAVGPVAKAAPAAAAVSQAAAAPQAPPAASTPAASQAPAAPAAAAPTPAAPTPAAPTPAAPQASPAAPASAPKESAPAPEQSAPAAQPAPAAQSTPAPEQSAPAPQSAPAQSAPAPQPAPASEQSAPAPQPAPAPEQPAPAPDQPAPAPAAA